MNKVLFPNSELELADVFKQGFPEYIGKYGPLPFAHYKIANNIMACRTGKLGYHLYRCDNCEHEITLNNSCRNRHCPKCQSVPRTAWIQARVKELLPVSYFHVVFTIPSELNPFALRNKKTLYDILFKSAKETLIQLAGDKSRLGAKIGCIGILHTWGQTLMDHPHIHFIVPGGGIREDKKKWKSTGGDFLFPFRVMSALFRGKFMAYFKEAVRERKIEFHGSLSEFEKDSRKFKNLVNTLYRKRWVVYAKKPFAGPEAVIKYLGQYTHRIAISNHRLVRMEKGRVIFKYKDYSDEGKTKEMNLSVVEFIRRFLLHALPSGYMRIRHFGFLANRNRAENLELAFKLLGKKMLAKQKAAEEGKKWNEIIKDQTGTDPLCCLVCGNGRLVKRPGNPREPVPLPMAS